MTDSILNTTKKLLGIAEENTEFDLDIILHINSVFTILTQLGVGPNKGFFVTDNSATHGLIRVRLSLRNDLPENAKIVPNNVRLLRRHVSVSKRSLLLLNTELSVTLTVLHGVYLTTSLASLLVNVF